MEIKKELVEWQTVHIFISSTFNDMHAERDYLVKKVFPLLSDWCEKRKIRMVDIDLRWGVLETDTMNKNVVSTCLKNIDECRPFFICLLGQRRGWVPGKDDISSDTYEKYPEIGKYLGNTSVTEMEILHSLIDPMHKTGLRNPQIPDEYYNPVKHAFFYLRDASYIDSIPAIPDLLRKTYTNEFIEEISERKKADDELKTWREIKIPATNRPTRNYSAQWNANDKNPDLLMPLVCPSAEPQILSQWRRLWKLAGFELNDTDSAIPSNLKEEAIKFNASLTNGRLGAFKFGDQELSDVIFSDLKESIQERFREHINIVEAESAQETVLQKEIDQQEQFVALNSIGFIQRKGDFDQLDEYAVNSSRKLFLLTAPAGMGKSMFLAKWVDRYRSKVNPGNNESLHFRFIGQSDKSTSFYNIWSTLLEEIKEHTGKIEDKKIKNEDGTMTIVEVIPYEPGKLRNSLFEMLKETGKKGKTIIVLDALNQFDTGFNDLGWLPSELPDGIKMIVSFKRDRGDEEAERLYNSLKDHVNLSEIRPFDSLKDRQNLIEQYLDQYLKKLDQKHIDALLELEASKNPLFLKIILSELRIFGAFLNINEKISTDFGNNPVSAFNGVLKRLENDKAYSTLPSKISVPIVFGLIANSRYGLSVDELAQMLLTTLNYEKDEEGLNQIKETIYLYFRQLRQYLARKEGRYDFFYESFKLASLHRYINEKSENCIVDFKRGENQFDKSIDAITLKNKEWHKILADYFFELPLVVKKSAKDIKQKQEQEYVINGDYTDEPNNRKVSELPYHLTMAEDWKRIEATIGNMLFIETKVRARMVSSLLTDFDKVLSHRELRNADIKILHDFDHFVRACSHRLMRRPDLTIQEALNFTRSAIICEQANEILTQRGLHWIRRIRPPANDNPYARCIQTIETGQSISSVSIAPDGKTILAALNGDDFKSGIIKAWDLSSGSCRDIFSGNNLEIQFLNQESSRLIIVMKRRKIYLFDLIKGKDCWEPLILEADIKALDFSGNGEWVIILDADNQLSKWDLRNRIRLWISKNAHDVCSISISPDERFVVTGGGEEIMPGNVEIFRTSDGELISAINGHEESVYRVLVLRNSHYIQTWCVDNKIRIWDIESCKCLKTVPCILNRETASDITKDGRFTLMVGKIRDQALVWDIASGARPVILSGHTDTLNKVSIKPDGKIAVTAALDNTLRIWDLQNNAEQVEAEGHRFRVHSVMITPDKRVVSAADNLKVWNTSIPESKSSERFEGQTRIFVPLPDCSRVLWNISVQWTLLSKQIMVVDLDTARCEYILKGHDDDITSIAALPGGRFALSGARDETIRMWNIDTGECSNVFMGGQNVFVSPDGGIFVSVSGQSGLIVRSLPMGKVIWSDPEVCQAEILIMPDAEKLVVARPECIEMRSIMNGKLLWRNENGTGDGHSIITVTPNGRHIVLKAYKKNIQVLNSDTGHELSELKDTSDDRAICPLPDGIHLVCCTDDAVYIRNLEYGSETGCYLTNDPGCSCSVSEDGQHIVVGSSTGHVYLLKLEGFSTGTSIVTSWQKSSDHPGINQSTYAFGCPYCRLWSQGSKTYAGLEYLCPNCGRQIRMNDFVLNGDWHPLEKAWEKVAVRLRQLPPEQIYQPHFHSSFRDSTFNKITLPDTTVQAVTELNQQEAALDTTARWCVGRDEYLAQLDDLITQNKKLVLLPGEPGIGKTAFLSRWVREYKKAFPWNLVFTHMIGATPRSTNPKDISSRITSLMSEFIEKSNSLEVLFDKIIIVIDALNLVEEYEFWNSSDLFPANLPPNVYMIVSASPCRVLLELRKQDHAELVLRGLNDIERKTALMLHLAAVKRNLSDDQTERIALAPQVANPLFLSLIAKLINGIDPGESLDIYIDSWLEKESPVELYYLLFDRIERQWNFMYPNPVRCVLSMLWAVKHGLTSDELQETAEITPECWHELYPSLQEWIINLSDSMILANDYLAEAVQLRYLPSAIEQKNVWTRVVKCLLNRNKTPRTISELLRVLELKEDWDQLKNLLTDREVFRIGWKANRAEYVRVWKIVSCHCRFEMESVISIAFDPNNVWSVVELLDELNQISASYSLMKHLAGVFREAKATGLLKTSLAAIVEGALKLKKPDEALMAAKELEVLSAQLNDTHGHMESLVYQADSRRQEGNLESALGLYNKVIEWNKANDLMDTYSHAHALRGLGYILMDNNNNGEALKCFYKEGEIYRISENKRELVESLARQAQACEKLGEIDKAIILLGEEESLAYEIGFKPGVYAALANHADLLDVKFKPGTARFYRKRSERLRNEIIAERDACALLARDNFNSAPTNK